MGKDQPFKIFDNEKNSYYLNMAKERGAAPIHRGPDEDDDDDAPLVAEEEMPPPIPSDDGAVPEAMDE